MAVELQVLAENGPYSRNARLQRISLFLADMYLIVIQSFFMMKTAMKWYKPVNARTIIVFKSLLLRNLDQLNNTIVHECVHWDQHRKHLNWSGYITAVPHESSVK